MNAKWYVVHVHSGAEKRVAASIREQVVMKKLEEKILEVLVPTEAVVEVKNGVKTNAEKKFFPGYVLVNMDLDDTSWHLIKNTPKVTNFLGGKRPTPISKREVDNILRQLEEGVDRPKSSILFEAGEQIRVIDGPFASFIGNVEEVDAEKERLKVLVSIFGRSTPVELEYTQVEKV